MLISCAVTAQLVCTFVLAYAKNFFSHNAFLSNDRSIKFQLHLQEFSCITVISLTTCRGWSISSHGYSRCWSWCCRSSCCLSPGGRGRSCLRSRLCGCRYGWCRLSCSCWIWCGLRWGRWLRGHIRNSLKNMSLVARKPALGVSYQVRHKPACTATESRNFGFKN